tara:strand:+ start:1711 stop:2613 length:903 start_codon:yes stop_codon:yes gene_type:complete
MKIALIGRTKMLLDTAEKLISEGHEISLIITCTHTPESEAKYIDFENLSKKLKCKYFFYRNFNEEVNKFLEDNPLDIGITMNWPTLIKKETVKHFNFGIINAHGSDLPKYRGNACPNWAILNGDEKLAVTFHMIDPMGLDTGDIVLKKYFDLNDNTYIGDVYKWFAKEIPKGFIESINFLKNGFKPIKQEGEAIRSYPRIPDDSKICWESSSDKILKLIRASSYPFEGAYCFYKSSIVRIFKANQYEVSFKYFAMQGQILLYSPNGFPVINCGGGGAIELTEFSLPNNENLPRHLRFRLE